MEKNKGKSREEKREEEAEMERERKDMTQGGGKKEESKNIQKARYSGRCMRKEGGKILTGAKP